MVEVSTFRKNKVNLADYDYKKDIHNRLLMANFTSIDFEILEEILYSPSKFTIQHLANQLEYSLDQIAPALKKLSHTGLFKIEGDALLIDKETRKYFETQIAKFEEDFQPGMDFLQTLLKKVPIHVLPNWYPIPRTSDNIFESLIEKYLHTPQTFQRYLSELSFPNPKLKEIIDEVMHAPNHKIYCEEIRNKYEMTEEELEEAVLYLEFNFVCCLIYEKQGDEWKEVLTLFKEWKEYLKFIQNSKPRSIAAYDEIRPFRPNEFSFIEDLTKLLLQIQKTPFELTLSDNEEWGLPRSQVNPIASLLEGFDLHHEQGYHFFTKYVSGLIQKLHFLKLISISGRKARETESAKEWLLLPIEDRALSSYRYTTAKAQLPHIPEEIYTERSLREIEKSISRIIGCGWVYFDDFMKGIIAPISDKSRMYLQKIGKSWQYTHPDYSEEEKNLIQTVILDWFFEAGIIRKGIHDERLCIQITLLGNSMFGS